MTDENLLARIRHMIEMGDQILGVTDRLDIRVTALEKGGGGGGGGVVYCNTKEYWSKQTTFVPPKGAIVIYSDYSTVGEDRNEKDVPNFKVGDGNAFVVDLPFSHDDLRAALAAHIADTSKHLSTEDRTKLEGSVTASAVKQSSGDYTLVLS